MGRLLTLRKVAITGGIASGKSSVCRIFEELGAFVVNADAIVHELLSPQTDLGQQVIRLLGNDVLVDGILDRRLIADRVFNNPEALHALESLLHPAVLHKIEELYKAACRSERFTLFVVESPLLFEIGHDSFYDVVIAITAPDSLCKDRFVRNGFSKQDYEIRMSRQISPKEKASRATIVIKNNGTLDDLRTAVIHANQKITTA